MATLYVWNKGALSEATGESFCASTGVSYVKGSQLYVVYPSLGSPPDLFKCINDCETVNPFDWQLTQVEGMVPEFRLTLSLRGIL